MSTNRDLVADGAVYRPALWEQAMMFSQWDPRTAPNRGDGSLDLPPSDDFSLTPWHVSPDRMNRINVSNWLASRNQRIWGFVASIEECSPATENTDTAYKFEIIARLCYLPDGQTKREPEWMSWLYVKVLAYSSNALLCGRTGIALGSFVTGIVTANYNGKGRATLDAWQVISDFTEWRRVSLETMTDPSCYDWTEWVVEWTCTLGGSAFAVDEPHENRINGVRLSPPLTDPHLYIRTRRELLKNTDEGDANRPRTVTISEDATYVRPRGRSSSRRPRGQSAARA